MHLVELLESIEMVEILFLDNIIDYWVVCDEFRHKRLQLQSLLGLLVVLFEAIVGRVVLETANCRFGMWGLRVQGNFHYYLSIIETNSKNIYSITHTLFS